MPEKEVSEEDMKNMSAEEIAELQKQNCIFCKIAAKEIPAKIIHEDKEVICILDINPASEGHILIYPKQHYMILPHVPDATLGVLFKNVQLMSNTLLKTLQCKGTSIFIANGMAAGQKAPHVLIHVFPRREGDGLLTLPKYEMNDEQSQKLHSTLAPYLEKLFGPSEVKPPAEEKKEEVKEEHHAKEHHDTHTTTKEKTHEKETATTTEEKKKKEPATKKKVAEKKTEQSTKKAVNLDDISRLFT